VEDLKGAIWKAREAQKEWSGLPVRERVRALRGTRAYLLQNADELATIISRDNGKTRVEALATEVLPAVVALNYYGKNAEKFLKPQNLRPGTLLLGNKRSKIVRVPYGVIGIISPWNYPLAIPFSEIVMGLLAGNGVIFKGATQTQLVGRAVETCIQAGNLPDGLFAFINIPGSIAGDALLESDIDKLFFTGSVSVGKRLMAKAAETLTPLSLELGGNDAMLVCEDADLDRAGSGAVWAGLQNCGQSCAGVERIYVQEAVYEPFLERLKTKVEALRVGPDTDFNVDMGAMTTQKQMEVVQHHLEDALTRGAQVAAQSPLPFEETFGNFLPATVLTQVHHGMLVMHEETFGPILAVMKVKDMEEALALANDSTYGLTGSVWSKDVKKAEQIGCKIQAAVITINDHLMSHGLPETPWGGFKSSGIGRTHGKMGFHEMTQPQVIVHDILSFAQKDLWWHPYNETLYQGIRGGLNLFFAPKLMNRLRGLMPFMKILSRVFQRKG
jgi:succinate-semialdehyde dehydrogenase/glutarate-semialdehyde dehydrogenase